MNNNKVESPEKGGIIISNLLTLGEQENYLCITLF